MKTTITQDQIRQYQEQGFLFYPNLLRSDEVALLKKAVIETVAQMGEKRPEDQKAFTQRLNLWKLNKTIRNYMLSPELGELLCKLEDIDGLRVWHDQALIKEPFGEPTAWHMDNPFWSFYSHHSISIWIALEDSTPFNGCLYFTPGSHKIGNFTDGNIGEGLGGLFRIYPRMSETPTVPVPLKAGDCTFHNGLTAHGAGANMTHGRRIALTCAYMPEGSTFNGKRNILPEAYFNSLKEGDILEDDEQNPIVYTARQLATA